MEKLFDEDVYKGWHCLNKVVRGCLSVEFILSVCLLSFKIRSGQKGQQTKNKYKFATQLC